MSYFKNLQELMTHLLSGGAITNLDDSCKETWISLYKGNLCFPQHDEPVSMDIIGNPTHWRPVPLSWLTESIQKRTQKVAKEDYVK